MNCRQLKKYFRKIDFRGRTLSSLPPKVLKYLYSTPYKAMFDKPIKWQEVSLKSMLDKPIKWVEISFPNLAKK